MSLVTVILISNYVKEGNKISNILSVYILTKITMHAESKFLSKISFLLQLVILTNVKLFIPKHWSHFILTDFKLNIITVAIQGLAWRGRHTSVEKGIEMPHVVLSCSVAHIFTASIDKENWNPETIGLTLEET